MTLYLTVCSDDRWNKPRRNYEREVPWESAPDADEIIFVGRDSDRESSSINARVVSRNFTTNGITVEVVIEYLANTGEYESVCESIVRDGFKLLHDFK